MVNRYLSIIHSFNGSYNEDTIMPTRAGRPCAIDNCPNIIAKGRYCGQHTPRKAKRKPQKRKQDNRPNITQRAGYGSRWRKIRTDYLSRHSRCEMCGEPATQVHHRRGVEYGHGDLMALCQSCHSRITRREGRRGA